MGRDTLKAFRFMDWQLTAEYFTPHYESDEYTAEELRLIADEMDKKKLDKARR